MKKTSVTLSYIVLTIIGLGILVFSTACGSSSGPPLPDPTATPVPTATPGDGSTPTPKPTPTPTVGRSTPVPGPTPTPLSASQGPLTPTTTDKAGAWFSNVYLADNGHQYMLVLTNIPSTNYKNLTWNQARQASSEKILGGKPGHLVTINSLNEQRLLMSTFDNSWGKTASETNTYPVKNAFAANGNGDNPIVGIALGSYKDSSGIWHWVTDEPCDISKGYWYAEYFPHNDGGVGNFLQIYSASYIDTYSGQVNISARYGWVDYAGDSGQTFGYLVEFEP
jgi:hypothetical protein